MFIFVKNGIDCRELWIDDDFEIIVVEVKGRDPKFTWEYYMLLMQSSRLKFPTYFSHICIHVK